MKDPLSNDARGGFVLYTSSEGDVKIEVVLKEESVWLTQQLMAELFQTSKQNISHHINSIYEEGELSPGSTVKKYLTVRQEGHRAVKRYLDHYDLDMIISVGYRVKSHVATRFRIWATKVLKEFMIKGFAIDDERLKQGASLFGKDYFEELLERIREIRASERRFYQKITDIYSLSVDYDKNSPITRDFFSTVQNKLHWAITGKTAAEMIYDSVDADKIHMGLTNWKGAPDGKILKSDVAIAKNYLNKAHLEELNRLVSAYLDLAENRARKRILTTMDEWVEFLNGFLELSDYPILMDKGKVSMLEARIKAEGEYEKFRVVQDEDFISDFDEEVKRITGEKKDN